MDTIKTLEEIAQLMDKYGLSEIDVENGEFKASMSKKPPMPPMPPIMPPMMQAPVMPAAPAPAAAPAAAPAQAAAPAMSGKIVKSPIVGTFYAAPAPDKAPYVTIGSQVKKGSVLFIIESMKLMNEVTSEFDGKVAEILVKDGEAVEFDQPIMRIE